jgi:hypothetical protein
VECLRLVQHLSTKDTVGFVDVSGEVDISVKSSHMFEFCSYCDVF